jgi:hypothetical protein
MATTKHYVCIACKSRRESVAGRCPDCGACDYASRILQHNLEDYMRGLDKGMLPRSLCVEPDYGGYFRVVDCETGARLFCGLNTERDAEDWIRKHGHFVTRSEADVLRLFT